MREPAGGKMHITSYWPGTESTARILLKIHPLVSLFLFSRLIPSSPMKIKIPPKIGQYPFYELDKFFQVCHASIGTPNDHIAPLNLKEVINVHPHTYVHLFIFNAFNR